MTPLTIARMIGIRGGIAIALGLALAFVMWRADTWHDRAERYAQSAANEKAAHAVTRASLGNLQQRLAVFIREGEDRAKAAETALRAQQERSVALGEQIARIRAEKPTARAAARCETPSAVLEADGL